MTLKSIVFEASKYCEDFDVSEKEKYKEKLMLGFGTEKSLLLTNSSFPYNIKSSRWQKDPDFWPNIKYINIVDYLMSPKCKFSAEDIKNYKSSAAYLYYKSGKIRALKSYTPFNAKGIIFLRANVLPLQPSNQVLHKPWILAEENGVILTTHCTCIAGLEEACDHVVAVLITAEEIVRRTIIEERCPWNCIITARPLFKYAHRLYRSQAD